MTSPLRAGIAALALSLAFPPAVAQERSLGAGSRVARAEVSTVTLDFSTGIKTTILSDGNVYEEGFDTIKMRRIASRPDANGVVGSR